MYHQILFLVSLLLPFTKAQEDAPKHGEGEEGSSMGPVAFLWPADRLWNAVNDNTGPCGSPNGPSNRTQFPLSQGEVALSIADDAWNVAFRIAYGNDPTSQAQFEDQVVNNVTEIIPGHQCYKLNTLEDVTAGQNATIQLEYWSEFEGENNGNNQSFFACADVTFVRAEDFTLPVPCFNVTSEDFNEPTPTSQPTASSADATSTSSTAPSTTPAPSSGLSTGAKAGVGVGVGVGGLLILGALAFFLYRRGKNTGLKNRESYELRAKKLDDGQGASATSAA